MGSIILGPEGLADNLSEIVGYKAGIALSVNEMCDLLSEAGYSDLIVESEKHLIRIRSEEYDEIYYTLLHKVGHTADISQGPLDVVKLFHKYRGTPLEQVLMGVLSIISELYPKILDKTIEQGESLVDPTPILEEAFRQFGKIGLDIAMEHIELMNRSVVLSPLSMSRYEDWGNIESLDTLFSGSNRPPAHGKYIDQRFIDYLSVNAKKIANMHWRKFEELTAEYFHREGYDVELGAGQNDDGVDVRVWHPGTSDNQPPHFIVQCKRQKDKIAKVVIKGLYADVLHENADYGLIVTSSEVSPGARKTIHARGYPIKESNYETLKEWLYKLRTPGTGIVRVK